MKQLVWILLLTYISATATAQTPQKDSVQVLLALAEQKLKTNASEARQFAEKASDYADKLDDKSGQANALLILGKVYYHLNKHQESLDVLQQAHTLFQSIGDSTNAGLSCSFMGNVYMQKLNQFANAYKHYNQALGFLRNDSANMIRTLNNIGTLHSRSENYAEALDTYKKVYSIAGRTGNLSMMSAALNNIGTIYYNRNDFRASIQYMEKGLQIKETLEDYLGISNTMNNLALSYLRIGNFNKADEIIMKAQALSGKYSFFDNYMYSLMIQSEVYEKKGDLKEALSLLKEAEAYAVQNNVILHNKSLFERFTTIYTTQGNMEQALAYQQKLAKWNETLAKKERKALAEMDHVNKNQTQIESREEAANPWLYALATSIIFAIGLTLFYTYRRTHSSESQLQPVAMETQIDPVVTQAQHIEVLNDEGVKMLNLDHILWFEKDGKIHYYAHTTSERFRVKQNMNELEQMLPADKFFRVNRAVIVNLDYINNYSFWENHKYIIRMKNESKTEFTISRNRLKEMKERFNLVELS